MTPDCGPDLPLLILHFQSSTEPQLFKQNELSGGVPSTTTATENSRPQQQAITNLSFSFLSSRVARAADGFSHTILQRETTRQAPLCKIPRNIRDALLSSSKSITGPECYMSHDGTIVRISGCTPLGANATATVRRGGRLESQPRVDAKNKSRAFRELSAFSG